MFEILNTDHDSDFHIQLAPWSSYVYILMNVSMEKNYQDDFLRNEITLTCMYVCMYVTDIRIVSQEIFIK